MTYGDELEKRIVELKSKMSSEEVNKIMEENEKIKNLHETYMEERKWTKEENRHYLCGEEGRGVQLENGDACSVFYSQLNGDKRYFISVATGLQGSVLIKEADEYDAKRLAAYLEGKPMVIVPKPPEIEIVEK
jgi:cupin superfamily acireductone dioxygenase involved in methionine salvage